MNITTKVFSRSSITLTAGWPVKILISVLFFWAVWSTFFGVPRVLAADTVIFVTSTASTTWTVPTDWNNASNTIEIIGAGGGGSTGAGSPGTQNKGGGGGGGAAYAKITGFSTSTGNLIKIQVGPGGAADTNGTLTYFNWNGSGSTSTCSGTTMSSCANAGGTGTFPNGGAAGASSTSVGTIRNAGGAGGAGQTAKNTNGGGAGGAAGPNGNGNVGQPSTGTSAGGSGDAGSGGTGGPAGTPPTSNGGDGTEWTTAGSGGGGGGANANTTAGGAGGLYGAGGGGGRSAGGAGGAGNQGVIVITYTPVVAPVTTLGDGTNPGNVTIAPGDSATSSDAFTFRTNVDTDVVTAVTVGLTPNTTSGLSKVEITNDAGSTVYGSSTDPTTDSFSVTLNESTLTATTATTTYRIRLTPKSHANMPAVPGSSYAVTSTIISFASANASSGTDGTSATITIDNASPANVSNASGTASSTQVNFSWVIPGDSDYHSAVVLRATSTITVAAAPVEGVTYIVGATTTASTTVACVVASPGTTCTDTGLVNGTAYSYRIFSRDTYANYASGTVPTGSPFTPRATTTLANGTQVATSTIGPETSAATSSIFTLQTTDGTSTITSANVSFSTSTGVYQIIISDNASTTVYGSSTNPGASPATIS
ncbi:MAG: hypothetical protein Q8O66_00900, partial [bacterium]|nr:hypothetical protein [bacterium]